MAERSLDDVVCGICGIAGEVYCGDGNEKNCCSIEGVLDSVVNYIGHIYIHTLTYTNTHTYIHEKTFFENTSVSLREREIANYLFSSCFWLLFLQIDYSDKELSGEPIALEEFLLRIKRYWVEKTVYTKAEIDNGHVNAATIPPIIAPIARATTVYNTEMQKRSIYLKGKNKINGMFMYNLVFATI